MGLIDIVAGCVGGGRNVMRLAARGIVFDAATAAPDCKSCAFTSVVRLASGDLLVGFRNATGRDAPDGRLRVMRSHDEGRRWDTLQEGLTATVDGVLGNLYAGYFAELAPDRLLGAFVWVDRSSPERSFVHPTTAGVLPMRTLLAESADGGASWGPFRVVDLAPHVGCSCTGPVMRLPGGTLALPYESWKGY